MSEIDMKQIKHIALSSKHRLFEEVLKLDYDNEPYIGHLITKNAIEKGYCPKRKNLKGRTIVEWAKNIKGNGLPNQWACISVVDMLIEHDVKPSEDDFELWATLLYYHNIDKNNESLVDMFNDLPDEYKKGVNPTKIMQFSMRI